MTMRTIPRVETVLALAALLLSDCQQQWVSPYSPELQKRASDMLSDVASWEGQIRNAAGTAAADPRHPDVQAKLNKWSGDIEVMALHLLAFTFLGPAIEFVFKKLVGGCARIGQICSPFV